ncbi:hypothetical protein [Paenibacillus alkalitolerans]|uniref:hypothetical protein n=1 Tax=Paenibacillus alkalitolerans TaxID=2799335 RepID=UPI0018F6E8C2|nr:hypothetical protein [Paenibacillus alkalitolerans]
MKKVKSAFVILLTVLVLATVLAGCGNSATGSPSQPAAPVKLATDTESNAVGKYLGRWNYDQPNRATMTNIATSNVPGRLQVPQIGDIVFTAEGPGRIVGRTDVGCTWRFKATPASLELDPPSQLCHNPTSNVAYTITQWTVTVEGVRENEIITAKSHRPEGDYDFVLKKGARTKAKEYDPDATTKFTGTWAYDPADPATGVNIRTTVRTAPDSTQNMERSPERGHVTITRDYANRITARTDDGCTWSLVARGNTAKLDPPIQTCMLPTSTAITISFWTIATDGRQQASVMTGTDERGGSFALSGGSLSKIK